MKPGLLTSELWAPLAGVFATAKLASEVSEHWQVQCAWILAVAWVGGRYIDGRSKVKAEESQQ